MASAVTRSISGTSCERSWMRSSLRSMPSTSWPNEFSVRTRERPTSPSPITANCLLNPSPYRYVLLRVGIPSRFPGRERQDQGYRSYPTKKHHPDDDQFSERREPLRHLHAEPHRPEGAGDLEDGRHELQPVGDHDGERRHDHDHRRDREHRERLLDEPPADPAPEGTDILLPPRLREG